MQSNERNGFWLELLNKLKVSCTCNVDRAGLIDFLKKSKWDMKLDFDELSGHLDLKIDIQLQEKEVTEIIIKHKE